MGYYGNGPGHKLPDQLSPFEEALRNVPLDTWQLTLDTLETLIKNIAQNPNEEKFRKIRLSNEKIRVSITSVDEALEALLLMGWELTDDEELVLPMDVKLSFPEHVKAILEAKQALKKKEEQDRLERGLSRIPPAQLAKEKKPKSAFQFQDRSVKENAVKRSEDNLAKLRKDKQEQFELKNINQFGQLSQPGNNPQRMEAARRVAPQGNNNQQGGSSSTMTVTENRTNSPDSEEKRHKVQSAFQFESRAKKEDAVNKAAEVVNDVRELQKQKYKSFKQDPNAYDNQQGFFSTGGGDGNSGGGNNNSSSSSWWDPTSWFSGGGNSGPPPNSGGRPERRGPRIKTMGDMPKPIRRG